MFNFFSEIKKKAGIVLGATAQSVLIGNSVLYVEGFEKIMTFTPLCIVIKTLSGVTTIMGEDLLIKEMQSSTITICGKIKTLENA